MTTPVQIEPGSNGNKEVFNVPQSSRTGASPSDGLVLYSGHLLERSYLSAEMHMVYSIALANWAEFLNCLIMILNNPY